MTKTKQPDNQHQHRIKSDSTPYQHRLNTDPGRRWFGGGTSKIGRRRRFAIISVAVAGVLLLGGGAVVVRHLSASTLNDEAVRIYLPENTDYYALLDTLTAHGVINTGHEHYTCFDNLARLRGLDKRVRPGSYAIQPQTRIFSLVRKLRNGQQDPIRLTIGKFRLPEQLNEYLNSKLMHNGFSIPLDSFYLIRPNTYEFYWTVTPERFMERMTEEFNNFWSKKPGHFDENLKNIIIIASIVEEETNNNTEKPLIASVYLNRLKRGMPLQADPTVKYAVGDFGLRRILNKHLAVESPFNTYLHAGLPPAPICLPSEASVDAVINAPETNYLYFCASDKMDGTHRFAATLAEHNRNAAAFHAALNARKIR